MHMGLAYLVQILAGSLHAAHGIFRDCTEQDYIPAENHSHDVIKDLKMAVYTYNIGAYDAVRRTRSIPEVPDNIKAFYIVDGSRDKLEPTSAAVLGTWESRGWKPVFVDRVEGTPYISTNRLTGKKVKFDPPSVVEDDFDWVVTHDSNLHIDIAALPSFVQKYRDSAIIMVDWRHWPQNYSLSGWEAMQWEMNKMLNGFQRSLITTEIGRQKCRDLLRMAEELRSKVQTDDDLFPTYFDGSMWMRNLKHERANDVKAAFEQVYAQSHVIERDQFLMPLNLAAKGLSSDIAVVRMDDLVNELGHCRIGGHYKPHGAL